MTKILDSSKPTKKDLKNLDAWILKDIENSGLDLSNFPVEPLKNEDELRERLGFTKVGPFKIIGIGGYWISYPGLDYYWRLKLKTTISTSESKVKYLSPKGSGNRAFIKASIKNSLGNYNPDKPILITEGEKKAAKSTLEGFPCIGLSGVYGFGDKENELIPELNELSWKNRTVYIVFDSDTTSKYEVGRAEIRLAIILMNRGAIVKSIRLPDEPGFDKIGLDDYLVNNDPKEFKKLIDEANTTLLQHLQDGTDYKLIIDELSKLDNEIEKEIILKSIAKKVGVRLGSIQEEYRKKLANKEDKKDKVKQPEYTDEQLENAEKLLRSEDILSRLIPFTKKLGFVGEEINQKFLYLSFTSRIMNDSISSIIKGASAGGKSQLTKIILKLFPKSEILNFSYVTSRALVHRSDDLSHKILYIAEHSGSEGSEYSIRTMLSEGEISIMLPVKNEITGNFETKEKRIPAEGLVFVETTTRDRIHSENQTRLFDLYIDDSETQTANILFIQAKQSGTQDPEIVEEIEIWQAAQTILRNEPVYIPYATDLAEKFPRKKTRARRDFKRLLSLISAHALLSQFKREIDKDGRLIATIEDFEKILPIAETVLSQTMKELTPIQENTLNVIENKFKDKEFSIKELEEKMEGLVSYRTLQRYCKHFDKEGIIKWNGQRGPESRYSMASSESICRNGRVFPPNLLETLKNKYDKCICRKDDVEDVNREGNDKDDKLGQKHFVASKSNDFSQITNEKDNNDNYDKDNKDELENWEEESNKFLMEDID